MHYPVYCDLDRGKMVKQIDKTLLTLGFATNYCHLSSPKYPTLNDSIDLGI